LVAEAGSPRCRCAGTPDLVGPKLPELGREAGEGRTLSTLIKDRKIVME
jgi:hypothetical protein